MNIKKHIVVVFLLCCTGSVAWAQSFIKVTGEVTKPVTLYEADIGKMNKVSVTLTDKDGKDHSYKGVPVLDLLNSAGVTTGKQLRGENLSKYVLVKCSDGYEVLSGNLPRSINDIEKVMREGNIRQNQEELH